MAINDRLLELIKKIDKFSPYPCCYPFVMSNSEKAMFDAVVIDAKYYLEFGLGGSTLRALQKSKAQIYTVESSIEWINEMMKYIYLRFHSNNRLHIYPVDIGPVREWGYPVSDKYKDNFERYSSDIYQFIDVDNLDLVLVDGRFRVACVLKLLIECQKNNNIKILIHDFWNRPQYNILLRYLYPIQKVDSIGLFSINKDIDIQSIIKLYNIYKFNPE